MNHLQIMRLKALGNEEVNMTILLAVHCAPIMKGSKAANIITVTREELFQIDYLLRDTGISSYPLKIREDKVILYLYREKKLNAYLGTVEVKKFLWEYGYYEEGIQGKLDRLSERVSLYGDGKIEFPHEIGIFLEYPLNDVKGFIENEGKNYIFSGYWKVYHNVQRARQLFQRYDAERETAVREVALGRTIREIAV